MQTTLHILEQLARYGVWDILSLLILVAGFIWGLATFWFRRKKLRNLTVFFNWRRDQENVFPLQLTVEITNRTQQVAFVTGLNFVPRNLRPHPNARYDAGSGRMELKFPEPAKVDGRDILLYKNFDAVIPNDSFTHSFACLDPSHTDEEIQRALDFKAAGTLYFYLTLLNRDEKPRVFKFKVPAYKKYDYGWWENVKYVMRRIPKKPIPSPGGPGSPQPGR